MKQNRKLASQRLLRDDAAVAEESRPTAAVHSDAVSAAWEEPGQHSEADEPDVRDEADELEGPAPSASDEDGHGADDALGLYLRQMGAIPLLNREQELALARRLETARQRYRRAALMSWRTLQRVVETFERVQAGETPLDPTIDVIKTLQRSRDQILARMPSNLRTLRHVLRLAGKDFQSYLRTRSASGQRRLRRELWRRVQKASR
jgi:RNA polymerase primary sigma factor